LDLGINLGFVHYIEQKKAKNHLNSNEKPSETFQSLDDLVTALSEEERTKYDDIMRSIEIPSSALESYCSWSNESYTRNCIIENEKFALILLCWEGGQVTPIHDHGGEECWVKIIEGEFRETIYKENEVGELNIVKTVISKSNDITYMIDFMGFHRLKNLANKRSMSLHLYAKPIRNCKMFDENSRKFVKKDLTNSTISKLVINLK
jgi:cysteine dioxygenase